jgi:hypothetical protein
MNPLSNQHEPLEREREERERVGEYYYNETYRGKRERYINPA